MPFRHDRQYTLIAPNGADDGECLCHPPPPAYQPRRRPVAVAPAIGETAKAGGPRQGFSEEQHGSNENYLVRGLALGMIGVTDLYLLLTTPDVGAITTAITALGVAVISLLVYGIKAINSARVEAKKTWDEANKDSLTAKLIDLQTSFDRFRKEAQEREQRLTEELRATKDELKQAREDYRVLMESIRHTSRQADSNARRITKLESQGTTPDPDVPPSRA